MRIKRDEIFTWKTRSYEEDHPDEVVFMVFEVSEFYCIDFTTRRSFPRFRYAILYTSVRLKLPVRIAKINNSHSWERRERERERGVRDAEDVGLNII